MHKRILITGKNSYIGMRLKAYLDNFRDKDGEPLYQVELISLKEESWKEKSFANYTAIFHMAGIAHADIGRVSEEIKQSYYDVNCNLTEQVALKARKEGVKLFIYMSSVIIYGDSAPVGKEKHITVDTVPSPANFYGDSKYQAELKLQALRTDEFKVAIVRSPMVYGKDSKGNYRTLEKLAGKFPVFPGISNERSMIYIENLTEFLRLLLENGEGGIYYPQNEEYVSTVQMVKAIAKAQGRRIYTWNILNPFVRIAAHIPGKIGGLANKAFGALTIDMDLSKKIEGYCKYNLEESIRRIHES